MGTYTQYTLHSINSWEPGSRTPFTPNRALRVHEFGGILQNLWNLLYFKSKYGHYLYFLTLKSNFRYFQILYRVLLLPNLHYEKNVRLFPFKGTPSREKALNFFYFLFRFMLSFERFATH